MIKEEVTGRVQDVFRDIFDDPKLTIVDAMTAADVPDWDSLAHVNLVSALEKEFKLRFAIAEIQELKNVGEMIGLILRKLPPA